MDTPLSHGPIADAILGHDRHGHGPRRVLVLHDWLGDCTGWDAVRPWLDGEAFTYVFADLRGYGRSRHLAGEYHVAEISADVLRLADRLGWQRFHLVGHSMTGMAAQRIAADAPARVASAVAVCPATAAGLGLDEAAQAFFARAMHDDEAFGRLVRFVTGGRLSEGWVRAKLRQHRTTVAPECRTGYLRMLVGTRFVDDVRGGTTPWLVLVGDRDPGIDEAAMRRSFLTWYADATLSVLADCGHYPMQERPPAFAAIVEAFLGGSGG